jgi:hypothetical protein
MIGGPVCTYKNKEIPCFVGCSPIASITLQMLADMLEQINSFGVFDRENESTPFLLLDGHHSYPSSVIFTTKNTHGPAALVFHMEAGC